jgi:hypothetical protein
MNKILFSSLMSLGIFMAGCSLEAQCSGHSNHEKNSGCCIENSQELGEQLVTKFWRDVKYQRVNAYSELIALNFRGLSISGHYNRNDQISGLENLTVSEFQLRRLRVSQFGNTLVISYNLVAEGEGITSGPSLDVWKQRKCGEWRLISHSYVPFEQQLN